MKIPDTIWHGGEILTMDAAAPRAEALAVADGRLLAVGRDADVLALAGPGTRRHDLHGRFVMPGLVESHSHALWGACRELFDVYVGYEARFGTLMQAVRDRAAQLAPGEVIHGGPWRYDMRASMGSDPKALLDAISTVHPIILLDTSQHVIWCNSLALELGGMTAESRPPAGGVIEHTESGAPNGILAEGGGAPVRALLRRSPAQLAEAARHFTSYFNSLGITAFKEPMAFEEDLRAYHTADTSGNLTLHMAAHLVRLSPSNPEPVSYDTLDRLRRDYASENIRTGFAKLFLDGVAPGHTASFSQPYLPAPGYDPARHDPDATLLMPPEMLNQTLVDLDRRGFTVKMHAVGDNAISRGLDAIAAARAANGASGLRHEIAHSVFVSDADLARFRALDAVAEMSPKLWFPNAATPAQLAVLGPERLEKAHRFRDLLDAGAALSYGSDWPASAPDANPWSGISGMVTRQNCDAAFPGTLAPMQSIGLGDALRICTLNGAATLRMEQETGSLEAGKWADFIVLEQSPERMQPQDIGAMEVLQTVWKGRSVHEA